MSQNFKKVSVSPEAPRTELHDVLGLTGCEVSVNRLPAGAAVPFVHAHRDNEEVYIVFEGRGEIWIDGEVVPLAAGDVFVVRPAGRRAIRAAADSPIAFACVQTKAGSLGAYTHGDGYLCEDKAPWLA